MLLHVRTRGSASLRTVEAGVGPELSDACRDCTIARAIARSGSDRQDPYAPKPPSALRPARPGIEKKTFTGSAACQADY